jgi:hypothetical protein
MGIGRKTIFKPAVMVAHRPDQLGPSSVLLDLAQAGLAGFEFLDDAGLCIPSDTGESADGRTIKRIAVVDDCLWLEFSYCPQQTLEGRGADARPEVRIAEHNDHAVLNAKLMTRRMIMGGLQVRKPAASAFILCNKLDFVPFLN